MELFSESPRDIGAWITFMESRGISRVVLLGVSFGGLKTVYYLTERADPRVAGAILAQAPMPGRIAIAISSGASTATRAAP